MIINVYMCSVGIFISLAIKRTFLIENELISHVCYNEATATYIRS